MYEYRCAKCKKTFEALQKFSDLPLKKHENCGGKLEKLLSAPAFQFKGTGWYVTDYGKGGVKPSTQSEESRAQAKNEASSDAKSTEAKSTDSTSSDSKSKDAKSSDATPSESKTEASASSKAKSKSSKKDKA